MAKRLWPGLLVGMLGLNLWKHWTVWRFFQRPTPPTPSTPEPVSILQPILSGDPTLEATLRANLDMQTRYPVEWLWLVDTDDAEAQRVCAQLQADEPDRMIQVVLVPPPDGRSNPKTAKLIVGETWARGTLLCVLDDDTTLLNGSLEACLPLLDEPGVGLVFGLPYYCSWDTPWSTLVSLFVNDHSLQTYIPYTTLTTPFTLNGMFYAVRRERWEELGGWRGLEGMVADDFAVAQRVRGAGYTLRQSAMCHPIRTTVRDARHYRSLMQRWFIFPRESLLRHLAWHEQGLLLALALLPAGFPLGLLLVRLLRPGWVPRGYLLAFFSHSLLRFVHFNRHYLRHATPNPLVPLVLLVEVLLPLQILAALVAPQQIVWRGHHIQIERGGGFRLVQRRGE